jgi:glucosamine-6-phosphate deaminase
MEIKILNKEEIDKIVADKIAKLIKNKPNAVLGLATGSTPLGVYKNLINLNKKGKVSFKNVSTFNLDEYVGIDETHNQSYRYFMNKNLFDEIDIDKNNTHFPNNKTSTPEVYDEQIKVAGGIDFQVLGIGSNGHIAFNEPNTPFDSLTHIVNLTDSTIKDNSRFFNSIDEVPTKAVSMGLKSIMSASEIVLIATGKNKAKQIVSFFGKSC